MRDILPQKDFIIMELKKINQSRIELPEAMDRMKDPTSEFRIIIKGPGCKFVKVDDGVVVPGEAVVEFTFNGRRLFLTREENIGAAIREMDR
jgi:hypothetical protein